MDYSTPAARHALRLELRERASKAHKQVQIARAALVKAQEEYERAVRLHRYALDGIEALDEMDDDSPRR